MAQEAQKEKSMILQKEMVEGLFNDLAHAKELGKKVCYTFIPGNLSELIRLMPYKVQCAKNLVHILKKLNVMLTPKMFVLMLNAM